MFKSYGGSGSVYDVTLQNFIEHKNAYSLHLNGIGPRKPRLLVAVFYITTLLSATGRGRALTVRNVVPSESSARMELHVIILCLRTLIYGLRLVL
jgi:hypothetical protein